MRSKPPPPASRCYDWEEPHVKCRPSGNDSAPVFGRALLHSWPWRLEALLPHFPGGDPTLVAHPDDRGNAESLLPTEAHLVPGKGPR